ncbi:uncharacterized protein PG998_011397 [Apiospora kogelbergensis]|uniref:uncharacterized protein n=1 Tax=Apiospora kogelbergensis TaxID=1337665 RepID=UPI00312CE0C2
MHNSCSQYSFPLKAVEVCTWLESGPTDQPTISPPRCAKVRKGLQAPTIAAKKELKTTEGHPRPPKATKPTVKTSPPFPPATAVAFDLRCSAAGSGPASAPASKAEAQHASGASGDNQILPGTPTLLGLQSHEVSSHGLTFASPDWVIDAAHAGFAARLRTRLDQTLQDDYASFM